MEKTYHLFIAGLLCFCISPASLVGQVQKEAAPYSFSNAVSRHVPTEVMPAADTSLLLLMGDNEDKRGEFTFGIEIPLSLNMMNSGLWETLPNGDRLWRLGLQSENARSTNLLFDRFHLPEGATLHIYTADSSYLLEAFTARHNLPGGTFATSLLPGGHIILEYYEPAAVCGQGIIHLSSLVHGCKDFYFKSGKYGRSGNCNIDIRCKEGQGYSNVKRAVCLILNRSKVLCTGTLINNTARDKTPYVLTAFHCLNSASAENLAFIFHYEADSCKSSSYQEGYSISGSTLVAKNYDSDFALLKLSQTPPIQYHPYYAGWNNLDSAAMSAVCIHHPDGDVKKISVCNQKLHSSDEQGYEQGNTHWKVPYWTKGTTEGGSSGCALLNPHGQIIGQLDGGTASCNYQQGYDVFGKLAYSWSSGGTTVATKRLRDWLDPTNKNVTELNGLNPDSSDFESDVILLDLLQPEENSCRMQFRPCLRWTNNGSRTITGIDLYYQLDSMETRHLLRKGSWAYGTIDTLVIDTLYSFPEGMHTIRVWADLPDDENHLNDTIIKRFTYHRGVSFNWEVKTDYYPDQTKWILKTANGDTIATNPEGMQFSTTYSDTFCLNEGCYDFVITDNAGDGLIGRDGQWQGYFHIYLQGQCIGSKIQFGYRDSIRFCIDSTLSVQSYPKPATTEALTLFPNPCQEQLKIRLAPLQEAAHRYVLFSVDGRRLLEGTFTGSETTLPVGTLAQGIYLIQVQGKRTNITRMFVKE